MRLSQPIMVVKSGCQGCQLAVKTLVVKKMAVRKLLSKLVVKNGCQRPLAVKILVVNLTT